MDMRSIYRYVFGPNTLGIGVENAALVRPMPPIAGGQPYGIKYNILGSIKTHEQAAQFPLAKFGPDVDLRANGVYLSGQIDLMALADFQKKAKANGT